MEVATSMHLRKCKKGTKQRKIFITVTGNPLLGELARTLLYALNRRP